MAASNASSCQWQVNTGGGFSNLSNSTVYSGVTSQTLTSFDATGIRVHVRNLIRQRKRLWHYFQASQSLAGPPAPVREQLVLTENNFLEQLHIIVGY